MRPRFACGRLAAMLAALLGAWTPSAQALDQLRLQQGENVVTSAVIDQQRGYAYWAVAEQEFRYSLPQSSATLVRLHLADFRRDGRLRLRAGENPLYAGVIDPQHARAFFGTYGDPNRGVPAQVIEIDLHGFRRQRVLPLEANEFGIQAAVADPAKGTLYFGTLFGTVAAVNPNEMQFIGSLGLQREDNGFQCAGVDLKGQSLYFGTAAGNIMKIRLSDLNPEANLTALRGEKGFSAAAIEPAGRYAFFATEGSPAKVLRLDLAGFRVDKTVILQPGEDRAIALFLDAPRRALRIVTGSRPARLVTLDMPALQRRHTAVLPETLGPASCAVMDPVRRIVLLGISAQPARIVRLPLPD